MVFGVAETAVGALGLAHWAVPFPSKEVTQVVGKDLPRLHTRALTQGLHVPPDVRAVKRFSRPGGKYRPGGFLCLAVFPQQTA